jgi:myosin-5
MDFNSGMVLQQLQYSGVFEAVQIRKSGFPFRYTHSDFRKRYQCVLGAGNRRTWPNDKQACLDLIAEMKQDVKQVQIGVTRVLYRAEQHQNMELIRNV